MIIVPVANDTIKTAKGLPSKVLSFTNYNVEGPAVIVQGEADVQTVFFKEIVSINDVKVRVIKNGDGLNIFEIDGYLKRAVQLPQPGSMIKTTERLLVRRLKLHVQNQLTRGLILECKAEDSDLIREVTLSEITNIERAIFSKSKFLAYYADYAEKGVA